MVAVLSLLFGAPRRRAFLAAAGLAGCLWLLFVPAAQSAPSDRLPVDSLGHLIGGLGIALQPLNLLLALGGVLVGTFVGMLPGVGPINAIAILIPVTFATGLPPESALILLVGIYYGSQYGNSISTILLNVPGTASAVVTALDGHAMTRAGRGGPALAMSAIASFVGGTVSIFGLVLFAPPCSPSGPSVSDRRSTSR